MRGMTLLLVSLLVLAPVAAVAQEAAPELPEDIAAKVEMFRAMGIEEEGALFMSVLSSSGMDPAQLILLMALMDKGGGGGDDAIGLMLLMNAMGGKQEGKQPVVLDRDESLLIIEDGVLYVLDVATMELKGSVAYRQGTQSNTEALMSLLGLIGSRRPPAPPPVEEETEDAASRRNLKQLALALNMYAADFGGSLPGENWVQDTKAYREHAGARAEVPAAADDLLVRPSQPGLPVGYAMNEKLLGAKLADIEDPAETVLLFESNVGGENPVGGPEAVPEEGVHDGLVNVIFVDGHCNSVPPDEAKELLGEILPNQ